MGEIDSQASQLQGLAVTTDSEHHGGSAVQGPIPQHRIHFSGALVLLSPPLELGDDASVWSQVVHWVLWFWGLLGGAG